MIASRTIALAILIQVAGIGGALAQAVEPEVPPPPAPGSAAVGAGGLGRPEGPSIATDPLVPDPLVDVTAPGVPAANPVTLSAVELEELRAMCSQRPDWRDISVCVRLRP